MAQEKIFGRSRTRQGEKFSLTGGLAIDRRPDRSPYNVTRDISAKPWLKYPLIALDGGFF
jgi:hypothetical protein